MPPILRFLLAQGLAFGLTAGLAMLPPVAGQVAGWGWVAVDALLALAGCASMRLPWWWLPIAVAMPFAVVAASGPALPWWVWAISLAALALVYGGGVVTRVPLYLSNQAAVKAVSDLIPLSPAVRVCDLGAGLGGPLAGLARQRPDALITGIEASPLPWLACRLRCLSRRNARAVFGDIFAHDLHGYDLVYAFLSPAPMPRLWSKAKAEMRPGTLLISNTFAVPDATPEQVIDLPGRADARLYVYRI